MRIRLIQPALSRRPMDTALKARMSPPLGLLTLAGLLGDDHEVSIENENVQALDLDAPADLVGITVTVDVVDRAAEIAARFRARGVPVVAGGVHPTSDPAGCAPHFDSVCVGAGDDTWPRIVADAAAGRLRPQYVSAARAEQLVGPAYERLDPTPYLYTSIVSTSRGCPHRCDFCYNSAVPAATRHRLRPLDDVVAEVRALGTRHVMFIDDNFVADPDRTAELLRRLAPLGLRWNAALTANVVAQPRVLDLMRATGCESLFVGFESLNPQALGGVRKTHNRVERFESLVRALHERDIMINGSFVFGLDGDTPGVFATTRDWIVAQKIETVTSHILTPYPGTAQYARLAAEERIVDHDLAHYDTAHVVFRPLGMSADELLAGYLWLYEQIYSWPNIVRRLPDSPRQRMPYLLFNLLYRKYGRLTEGLCRAASFERVGRLSRRLAYGV